MRNGNILKSRVSEIFLKRIRVKRGVGVLKFGSIKIFESITRILNMFLLGYLVKSRNCNFLNWFEFNILEFCY